ncbi:MBL fold metallo-hydrolase [Dysgonomonas sp. Marseille-P4677]|uniref:MBL fold metallo-hydrolase n=1 Tax=Dysgonomonas sp. Marseille-P4677 TaxID=2364790 RepID=UPI00191479F9|nr:MBL fold metallo-hydrolase [Dysgonomonas sp. Marseille-P4677]MBK5720667.1 MBL fold metallo-hydrolase [Dysgonomonas sp. Marseille-P4677]
MKLTYIYHSGYVITTEKISVIIDYYKDSSDKDPIVDKLLKRKGKLYILSTHSHADHFNPEILKWKETKKDITYIFSKDILDNNLAKPKDAIYLDKLDIYKDKDIFIQAFGSTDLGVSYLIHIKDKTIFHAGDLNNWHWNEESTQEEIKEAEDYYESELKLLAANVKHIDLAMFPIDPRLGKDYMKGAEQFIDTIKVNTLVPMHFDEAYDKVAAFSVLAAPKGCNFISWKYKGESIEF